MPRNKTNKELAIKTENDASAQKKLKENLTTPQLPIEKKCFIHQDVDQSVVDDIREFVCTNDVPLFEFAGENYCLFHAPTADKDIELFNKIFDERLKTEEAKLTPMGKTRAKMHESNLSPAEKARMSSRKGCHDYRLVWFPSEIDLSGRTFSVNADFKSATFSESVDFSFVKFTVGAIFSSVVFRANANFSSAEFTGQGEFNSSEFFAKVDFSHAHFSVAADFMSVRFDDEISFNSTKFSNVALFMGAVFLETASFHEAEFVWTAGFSSVVFHTKSSFRSATFAGPALFDGATFFGYAVFVKSKFLETSTVAFRDTRFCSRVLFYQAICDGYIEFDGYVFLENAQVKAIRDEMNLDAPEGNQEASLSLNEARLNKPDRISFSSIKLRLFWFVNAEVRNLVFNDVTWKNLEIDLSRNGLDDELDQLSQREVKRPSESLITACNQLADNADANRRFEEAKSFRKLGIALDGHDCHVSDVVDSHKKSSIHKGVCGEYPVVNESGGNYFCVLHNPDINKLEVFRNEFLRIKESRSDFRSVVFPNSIEYIGDIHKNLNFEGAAFFRRVHFELATIHDLNFTNACFKEDSELILTRAKCSGKISLERANIEGKISVTGDYYDFFENSDKSFSMKEARIENPNWVSFHGIRLRPHYFVDVDASNFVFHDCLWTISTETKLNAKKEVRLGYSYKDIAKTCNQFAKNYEENRNYEQASEFRYAAMEAKRLDHDNPIRFYANLYWLYKWTSGYGESWKLAALVLFMVLSLFALLYSIPISKFDHGEQKREVATEQVEQMIFDVSAIGERFRYLTWDEAIVHSLSVAALQRPEPKPANTLTRLFVILETIFAPLQVALLALAIRRKFMR